MWDKDIELTIEFLNANTNNIDNQTLLKLLYLYYCNSALKNTELSEYLDKYIETYLFNKTQCCDSSIDTINPLFHDVPVNERLLSAGILDFL